MRQVLLLQLDGKLPNIALMRIASHHLQQGDAVDFRQVADITSAAPTLWESPDLVYASAIFEKTRPIVDCARESFPGAMIGGTGVDLQLSLEDCGITTLDQDYSIYPNWRHSIGFTQRGCRFRCPFCVVPEKEGAVTDEQTISDIWRGEPWPREVVLLDNDFFGQLGWRSRIEEIKSGKFKVSFNQGINIRALTDEQAAAIASVDYRDGHLKARRIYTAWDNMKDENPIFRGLRRLIAHGVKPHHIMVYMLIGYWSGETASDRDYRRRLLRELGCLPYPMTYCRTPELVGFQRWVIGAYDKRVAWDDWARAKYDPHKLSMTCDDMGFGLTSHK